MWNFYIAWPYSGACLVRPPYWPLKIWSLKTGCTLVTNSIALKSMIFCQGYVIFQDRWSLTAVVCQDRFHCNRKINTLAMADILPAMFFNNPRRGGAVTICHNGAMKLSGILLYNFIYEVQLYYRLQWKPREHLIRNPCKDSVQVPLAPPTIGISYIKMTLYRL